MARRTITVTLGQSLGEGRFNTEAKTSAPPSGDVTATSDAIVALAANIVTAQASVATAATDALAVQAANTAVTPVENAVALLEADGASPTQAHVTALRSVWNTLSAACTAQNGAANTVATTAATAKTNTDALNTTAASDALALVVADEAGNVVLDFDTAVVTSKNALRAALKAALLVVDGSSELTP